MEIKQKEDINVYVKCYYNQNYHYRLLSKTNTSRVWKYLISDATFNEFLHRMIGEAEKMMTKTIQNLQEMGVDIFYEDDNLKVIQRFYTVDGGKIELGPVKLSFDGLSGPEDKVQKGHPVEYAILKECNRINRKSCCFFIFALLIFIVPAASLFLYALSISSVCLMTVSIFLLLPLLRHDLIYEYSICRYLPEETGLCLKLGADVLTKERHLLIQN